MTMIDLQIRSAVSNRVTFLKSMVRPAINLDAGFRGENSLITDRTRFRQIFVNLRISERFSGLLLGETMDSSQPPYKIFALNRDNCASWKQRR